MANTLSAKQRIRNSARKAKYNRLHRSRARTFIKNSRELIAQKDTEEAKSQVMLAISALDRAAGKGIIHPNNAARRKSRLLKLFSKATVKK